MRQLCESRLYGCCTWNFHLGVQHPLQMGGNSSGKSGVLLATGALDFLNRTQTAEGLSAEENTDHVLLRFIQSNLQRSKFGTSELLVEADRRKIAVALVQEPYVGNIGELRRYPGCRVIQKAFAVRMGRRSGPRPPTGTRVYNTTKARWSEFGTAMDAALTERTLTVEMVKSADSCDQLDGIVETYTECIRQAYEAAIPPRNSERRLKLPWCCPELEGLKKDARTKR
ncbi:hypothetical protein EVAR_34095_1 [Eumeta japonica]|uniref:Uncharacterized protein n=1 Tax=Eumeta variegata TaxID=151549 RepID=A0A4C1WLX9_EUMVA|nr:hypothetical protein EVAR_34095_1 [Eumeta japonica]